jgi:hypothetical protein
MAHLRGKSKAYMAGARARSIVWKQGRAPTGWACRRSTLLAQAKRRTDMRSAPPGNRSLCASKDLAAARGIFIDPNLQRITQRYRRP